MRDRWRLNKHIEMIRTKEVTIKHCKEVIEKMC